MGKRSVNKVLYESGWSIPEIFEISGTPKSTVRNWLINDGVTMRANGEGWKVSGKARAYINGRRGVKRPPFTEEHKRRISAGRIAFGNLHAAGVCIHNGYLTFTRGPHKFRAVHTVKVEERIGRRLVRWKEAVHHDDEVKTNNADENLKLLSVSEHARLHRLRDLARGVRLEEHFRKG